MLYDISLAIDYDYAATSDRSRTLLHLLPRALPGEQRVIAGRLAIEPLPDERRDGLDFWGNPTTTAVWHQPIDHLRLSLSLRVERRPPAAPADLSPRLADLPAALAAIADLGPDSPHHFTRPSARVPEVAAIAAFAREAVPPGLTTREAIERLSEALHRTLRFDAAATSVETGPAEAFEQKSGVCQDFAHVMIAGLRALGIPAGYVSGFLRTLPPPGQPRLEGADAMHAWVRAWAGPVSGWIDIDPTNDQLAGEDYVTLARGRDYADIAPVKGAIRTAGHQQTNHKVDVVPVGAG